MRNKILMFLLCLFPMFLMSQVDVIKEYKKTVKVQKKLLKADFKAESRALGRAAAKFNFTPIWDQFEFYAKRGEEELKKGMDVVLTPLEQINFPSYVNAGTGDWGDEFLQLEQRYDDIVDKLLIEGRKVRVVVFDTGKPSHSQLEDLMDHSNGRNWTSSASVDDIHSHSSHCLGIIAGADNEAARDAVADAGLLELAWQKVLGDNGSGSYSWITKAVEHENIVSKKKIEEENYFVIYSFSLGGGNSYQPLEQAFNDALDLGVIVFASAGNTNSDVGYPGKSFFTNAVAALAKSGSSVVRAGYSSFGTEVFSAAPGSHIYSTLPNNAYGYKSGTSMSCPYMVRIAANLAAINVDGSSRQIEHHFELYNTDLPPTDWDKYTGFGWPVVTALLENPLIDDPPPKAPFPVIPPPEKLDPPRLNQPPNGSKYLDDKVLFTWAKVTDALKYRLQVTDTQTGRVRAEYLITGNALFVGLDSLKTYSWKVRSESLPTVSPWSEVWTFSTKGGGEPPPPPPPPGPKPERVYTGSFPYSKPFFMIEWKAAGSSKMNNFYFRINVSAKTKKQMDDFAEELEEITDTHFISRTYSLSTTQGQPDIWDAGKWVAFFYELIEGKKIDGLNVISIDAFDDKGTQIIMNESDFSGTSARMEKELIRLNANFFQN